VELVLKNINGNDIDKITFLDNADLENINTVIIHEIVLNYLSNQREGNACTKTRAEVSGGGKKPWKQKGTGRARAGSNRSPLWRHGGIIFGPKPRSYSYAVPQKKRRQALLNSLLLKLVNNKILAFDSFTGKDFFKTKMMVDFLNKQNLKNELLTIKLKNIKVFSEIKTNMALFNLENSMNINIYLLGCAKFKFNHIFIKILKI